jgi:NADH dehydrogenase [ubiquinone] 1 alpha subcomplex assembly factor 1
MDKEKLRTVGVSFLGGNSAFEGRYELWIDHIRIVNDWDVTKSGE